MRSVKVKVFFAAVASAVALSGCVGSKTVYQDADSMNNPIRIGWAKRSIVPTHGTVPVTGQFYLRVALDQRTPMLTSAMVMENGKETIVFVPINRTLYLLRKMLLFAFF